eukprot:Awhi_evm3s13047
MTYNVRDSLNLYTTELLTRVDNSNYFSSPLSSTVNKLVSSFHDYFMAGGKNGEANYWRHAQDMIETYETERKTWFLADSKQHCYTCLNVMYNQVANDKVKMVDWIQSGVNNLLNGNKQLAAKTCDLSDGLSCPK